MRKDRVHSISKSDRNFLRKLAKDLCVDSEELDSFISKATSYNQAHTKILNLYDDIYTNLGNYNHGLRTNSSGLVFMA